MNHWPFIVAVYAIAVLGTAALVALSYAAMRRGESAAGDLRGE